jgi:glycosyltransferase involved in cell wall biosynthesis
MLAEGLPPLFGGAVYQALRLAGELRHRGAAIIFLGRQPEGNPPVESTLDGFPVFRVWPGGPVRGKRTKLRLLLGYLRVLARERCRYDVLHVHGPYLLTLGVGFWVQQFRGKKLVLKLTLLGYDNPAAIKRLNHGWLAWQGYRRADAFVCISRSQYDECLQHGLPPERVFWIPNAVDTRRFYPPKTPAERLAVIRQLGLTPGFRYVVFIGSIEPRKGVDFLVEVAAGVCARHPDVKFLLIGPDGRRAVEEHLDLAFVAAINARIKALKLEDRVLLLGHQANTQEYLRAATLFVFTSRAEGFGTVVIEAMASGLPSVVLDIPGVTADIITTGKDGIIISGENPAPFAAAINRVLEDPVWAGQLGAAACQTVRERFDLEVVGQKYLNLYSTLLKPDS